MERGDLKTDFEPILAQIPWSSPLAFAAPVKRPCSELQGREGLPFIAFEQDCSPHAFPVRFNILGKQNYNTDQGGKHRKEQVPKQVPLGVPEQK